jgi:hypothetical protein
MLLALVAAGVGVLGALWPERFPVPHYVDDPPQPVTPAEQGLWNIGWVVMGLGVFCLGMTTLRYSRGQFIVVPASAPLVDHIIWGLFFVCFLGGFAVMGTGLWIRRLHARRRISNGL